MSDTKPTPNTRLRNERDRRCWSQQELAEKLGTTPLNIGRWERGETKPGPHFRKQLSEVFEKSPQELGLVASKKDASSSSETETVPIAPTPASPISLWNVPYRRNSFFTGREDILTQLRTALLSDDHHPIALTQPQAISGLGGIGKTQTAVEYAHRYRESYPFVLWARADAYDLLTSDFLSIAALLALPERNEQDQSVVVKAVLRWLDRHDNWLLVLDNADELSVVEEFLPSAGKGHVLLTTRAQSTGTLAEQLELEKMTTDEATFFLLRRTKRLKGAKTLAEVPAMTCIQAQAIVEEVDCLPLALDQAGAYIEETSCSFTDYLKLYKTRRNKLLKTRGRDATGHPEPVAATWALSFEKVERANPAAADLLRLCAFLHPDAIPEKMIMDGASELGDVLQLVAEDEMELNDAIRELLRYSLVRRDAEAKTINIHRLVQAVVRDGMKKDEEREWAERTVQMMSKVYPDPEMLEGLLTCQQYFPHVSTCTKFIEQYKMTSGDVLVLLNNIGKYLQAQGLYTEAEHVFLQKLSIQKQSLAFDHLIIAKSLNQVGQIYWMQDKYVQAEAFYSQALVIREQVLDPLHLDIAESRHDLALVYHYQGKYERAESLLLRVLAVFEQVKGEEDTAVATILNNLAKLYDAKGHSEQAETAHLRSLAIREEMFGTNHPDVAISVNDLGLHYWNTGRYLEAESFYQRARSIGENIYGLKHPSVAATLNNLGLLYDDQEKYEQAESAYKQALDIWEQTLGPNHSHIASALNNLASSFRQLRRYKEAKALYLKALKMRELVLGPEHIHVAYSLNGLAQLYSTQAKYKEAEPLFLKALAIREKVLGIEHLDVAKVLEPYSVLLHKINRYDEAVALEERAQAIRTKQSQ